jgi:hypothetical protein
MKEIDVFSLEYDELMQDWLFNKYWIELNSITYEKYCLDFEKENDNYNFIS